MMRRRRLLKLSLGTAVASMLVGGGIAMLQPGVSNGRLTSSGTHVLGAVARAVLDGSLPREPTANGAALKAHLARVDAAVSAFPPSMQSELSQLLSILATSPGRVGLAGLHIDWRLATVADVQSALERLRTSSLVLRQQVYHALRDLTNAAYYADPSTWSALGYPGPQTV